MSRETTQVEAFGETKSLAAWARDERCAVKTSTLRKRLMELNWEPERALTTAPDKHPPGAGGHFSAFGESKSIAQWAADGRCAVLETALRVRLMRGWDMERAITQPPDMSGHATRATTQQRREAVDAYLGGLSIAQVADRFGVSRQAVSNWLAKGQPPQRP